jgi:hypothetical protein
MIETPKACCKSAASRKLAPLRGGARRKIALTPL